MNDLHLCISLFSDNEYIDNNIDYQYIDNVIDINLNIDQHHYMYVLQ